MLQKHIIKNFFVTGLPGTGKSSLVLSIAEHLLESGITVRGIICPEIRRRGRRWGFKIKVFPDGPEGILASVETPSVYRVSKYGVNIESFEKIGVLALKDALGDPNIQVILVDEIGKMELLSKKFRETILKILNSPKVVLGVIGRIKDPIINNIQRRGDTKIFVLRRNMSQNERNKIRATIEEGIIRALNALRAEK